MARYHFDSDYCEVVTLRDGQMVHLRLICPSDKDMLRAAFMRMSPETRYRRFFSAKIRLTEREIQYLTEIDQVNHFAIGAERITPDGGLEGLGVARFIRYPDLPDTAEAAVTVIDDVQGKGLGSLLFQRLVAAARERGITRLRCEVLTSNQPMHDLVRSLAQGQISVRSHGTTSTLDFALPDLSPANPPDEPPRQDALYQLFTMVARGAVHMAEHPLGEIPDEHADTATGPA